MGTDSKSQFILDGRVETPGKGLGYRHVVDSGLCSGSQQWKWRANQEAKSEDHEYRWHIVSQSQGKTVSGLLGTLGAGRTNFRPHLLVGWRLLKSSLPSLGLVQELGRGSLEPLNKQARALQSRAASQVDDESSCLRNIGKGTASSSTYVTSARSWCSHLESCPRSQEHRL